ncbi:MAG: glycosyltransferase, partial [Alphaproteobacteria bacterium]|nr:glycosyltransferase [Alphaproteobacteria bacterium]
TLQEIEIICIDDKSTDNSLEILRKYEKKDARIKVIAQDENKGQGSAKNVGIAKATGEYLGFVDPDDYISDNYFKSLLEAALINDADVAWINNIAWISDKETIKKNTGLENIKSIATHEDERLRMILFTGVVWGGIYKHNMILKNNIQFWDSRNNGEDTFFKIPAIFSANKIAVENTATYYYIMHGGNHTINLTEKDTKIIDMYEALFDKYNNNDPIKNAIVKRAIIDITDSYNKMKITERETIRKNLHKLPFADKFGDSMNYEIIISLTSYPARIETVHLAIEKLLNQTYKADRVILWLARPQFPNGNADLPAKLLTQKEQGLEIEWLDEDICSFKKLIPALEKYPDALIITADDDLFYPNNWLQELLLAYNKNPHVVHAARTRTIQFNNIGLIIPYRNWPFSKKDNVPKYSTFFTGIGGVVWKKEFLHPDVFKKDLFMKLAPRADDIWFWAMALLKGTKINYVKSIYGNNIGLSQFIIPNTQYTSLEQTNVYNNENDFQMAAVIKQYPQILNILHSEIYIPAWKGVIKRVPSPSKIDYYLFGILNIMKKQIKEGSNKYTLFGFLPILKVKKKEKNNYIKRTYNLFSVLPVLTIKKAKEKQTKYKLFGVLPLEKLLSIYKENKYGIYYCNIWILFIKLKFRQNSKTIIRLLQANMDLSKKHNHDLYRLEKFIDTKFKEINRNTKNN